MDMQQFREQLRKARESAGLTVEQAAEAADLTAQQWQYLEWNRRTPPPVPVLRRILEVVDLDADATLKACGLL